MDPSLRNTLVSIAIIVGLLQPLTGFTKPKKPSPHTNSEHADLIIVGAGLAGLSAALEAGRSGAKVLVIDEASIFGGRAIMSERELNIVDSPFQRSKMPRGSQLVLGHAVTSPPVRDGPDGITDSGRDRPKRVAAKAVVPQSNFLPVEYSVPRVSLRRGPLIEGNELDVCCRDSLQERTGSRLCVRWFQ